MVTKEKPGESPFKTQADADAEATEQRKALVKKILSDISSWKTHHKTAFDRMRRNVKFVRNAGNEQWRDGAGMLAADERYVANITHRFIQQKVSSLYARDPRVKAKRRPMIDGIVWDGRQETLETAMATLGMAMAGPPKGPPPDPKVELAKAKLEIDAKDAAATAALAAQKQQADAADKAAARENDRQKILLDARFRQQELDIRRQEIGLKSQELVLKKREMEQQGRALAVDSLHRVADRDVALTTNRETLGAAAAGQQAEHAHATETAAAERAHDAEKHKGDLSVKKAAVTKKAKDTKNAK